MTLQTSYNFVLHISLKPRTIPVLVSQDTCYIKVHDFCLIMTLAPLDFGLSEHKQLINSVCYSRGWRKAAHRVVCGVHVSYERS